MIRLAMLARDEADQVAGVAAAVGELVDDYVVLVDDRSADDTEAALKRELGAGAIEHFRFRNFAQARNELFVAARRGLHAGDYLLLVDPDSPPRGRLPGDLASSPSWSCTWSSGTVDYHLPILVDAGAACHYVGACHELLVGVSPRWTPELVVTVDPPRPGKANRSAEYAELLRPDAELGEPRAAFYLARSLQDAGRVGEAIEWYLRRAQIGTGWVEETFLSLVSAGALLLALDIELAAVLLKRARAYRPGRAEPLYHLAWLANWRGDHDEAAELAADGLLMPPSTDALFVNRWCESQGLVDELTVAARAGARVPAKLATLSLEGVPHG